MWFSLLVVYELNGIIVENIISFSCFWLTQEKSFKNKTTELIDYYYWVVMIQVERVNPKPSPTYSAWESEKDKAKAGCNRGYQCSREINLIGSKFLERQLTNTKV